MNPVVLFIVFMLMLSGCAHQKMATVAKGLSFVSLDRVYTDKFNAVSQCTGLPGPQPKISWQPTCPCPTSKRMQCLCSSKPYPCPPPNQAKLCANAGEYDADHLTVVLPDKYDAGYKHEICHHLLWVNKRRDWFVHTNPCFTKCVR